MQQHHFDVLIHEEEHKFVPRYKFASPPYYREEHKFVPRYKFASPPYYREEHEDEKLE
jgi:hypothetical protein